MNRPLAVSAVAAAIALALAAGYWAGSRVPAAPASAAAPEAAAGKNERKILYYRNPMGLPDTSPTPKKDSMGMDYIPVYAGDEPADSGVVKVSPDRIQTLGVRTATAELHNIDAGVRAVGRIEVNERAIYDVSPKFDGWIEKLYVNATGDPVKRGQPLFSVYSPELVSAGKEVAIAEGLDAPGADPAAREAARRLAAAGRERLQNWNVAAPEGKSPQRLTFNSPATGIVLEKKAVEGMRLMPGTAIYRIADLSTVWVIADVYEQDLARVKVGEQAMVEIDAYPGRHIAARITYLYPTLNTPTRTTPVRIELPNRDGLLRPGMFAHVEIAAGGTTPRLAVPTSAVIDNGDSQLVLMALGEGRFKPQPVKVGLRGSDSVEIRDGLKAGDRVVVGANFLIDAESNLKAALSGFGADKDAAQAPAATAKLFRGIGSFDAIDAAGNVTISHQPIAELHWPAMTMDFTLTSPKLAAGLKPGTPIRFEFEQRGPGEFVVTKIEPAGNH